MHNGSLDVSLTPEAVVQRQLDAYNSRDIDRLMATYADDAEQFEHPSKLLASGSAQIRQRSLARFEEPNLHAELRDRIAIGNFVIDQELVTRTFPDGTGKIELVAIYEVLNGKISKAWFILGAKKLDAKS
jgi:hypothetical protein